MVNDNHLVQAIRKETAHLLNVEEKRMFGGVAFLVDRKMCINVGRSGIICRIDPNIHDELIQTGKCRTVVMRGREYKGWIRVDAADVRSRQQLIPWLQLALDFNARAKPAKKRK
jgi:TfoX/Sxy family transcriptional regulator of competence genes